MRILIAVAALLLTASATGQTACPSPELTQAAGTVVAIRHRLHGLGVPVDSPEIPATVAAQLPQLQEGLAKAAEAALQCAGVAASAETVQQTLATALHANLPPGSEAASVSTAKRDVGTFGADLAVQVFQLFGTPRLFEVDFRYGMECGDDNLLLIFRAASDTAADGWHEEMRYGAGTYKTASDALGDFILLSPLPGDATHPVWRYLVAHGRPGCGEPPRSSEFTLELLTPGGNPAQPERTWSFKHPYTAGDVVPRLATTENTIDFRLVPAAARDAKAAEAASAPAAAAPSASPVAEYHFRLTPQGRVEPDATHTAASASPETPSRP